MSIVEKIRDAGIVGCGGAGFPTHAKLKGKIEYLIINGAECEPLLRTDRYIMCKEAPNLVRALVALKEELCIPDCVIALKEHYREEANALRKAISETNAPIRLHLMESFYPAGDEQTIVYEVTGRVVPPGGIPIAVGAVVNNVATIYAISQAMYNYEIKDIICASPYRVEIPLKMHIGMPAAEKVTVGDRVRVGQVIAQPPEGALGAVIHASITGRVVSVGDWIVIEKE